MIPPRVFTTYPETASTWCPSELVSIIPVQAYLSDEINVNPVYMYDPKHVGAHRALRIYATALWSGAEITLASNYEHKVTNLSPEFQAKFPIQMVPSFETADGEFISEGSAIAWYSERASARRLSSMLTALSQSQLSPNPRSCQRHSWVKRRSPNGNRLWTLRFCPSSSTFMGLNEGSCREESKFSKQVSSEPLVDSGNWMICSSQRRRRERRNFSWAPS